MRVTSPSAGGEEEEVAINDDVSSSSDDAKERLIKQQRPEAAASKATGADVNNAKNGTGKRQGGEFVTLRQARIFESPSSSSSSSSSSDVVTRSLGDIMLAGSVVVDGEGWGRVRRVGEGCVVSGWIRDGRFFC